MLYELRIYRPAPGKLPALLSRLENRTLKCWDKHGIRPVGFWTVCIGECNEDLYYMLEWQSLAEREEKWRAFTTDSEWRSARAETEEAGPLVLTITNVILSPTSFSKMK